MGIFNKKTYQEKKQETQDVQQQSTLDLFLDVAAQLGIKAEKEESGEIVINYMGENFVVYNNTENPYILIRDLWWHGASLDNLANTSLIRKAINECNIRGDCTFFYSHNNETNEIGVHTQLIIPFIKEIPNIQEYLRSNLNGLLSAHHLFFKCMEHLREEEYSKNNH